MNNLEYSLILFLGSLAAGLLGALSGLGGGVILVPLLVLGLGIDIHYAIGTSLVAVIATSSGASAAYIKEGFTNIRIGMLLETATSIGAIIGAVLSFWVPVHFLFTLFGVVLIYSAYLSLKPLELYPKAGREVDPITRYFGLGGNYPSLEGPKKYEVRDLPLGYLILFFAGLFSGMLGIGSGSVKVVAMDRIMRIPFKVSTTTSNFMIGVTAAAGVGIYLKSGYIEPSLVMPVMIGVIFGALAGSVLLVKTKTRYLRYIFAILIFVLGGQMIYRGLVGGAFGF